MHSRETSTPLYFIHLGDAALPSYYRHSLAQARENFKGRICLVCEQPGEVAIRVCQSLDVQIVKPSTLKKSSAHQDFLAHGNTDKSFRDGFWTFVIERFFTLEEVMTRDQARVAIHLEGDNLIFTNLENLILKLNAARPTLAVPFDHESRGIAGFMWIGSIDALRGFTNFIGQFTLAGELGRMNDMDLLGYYRRIAPKEIDSLPVIPGSYEGPYQNLLGELANDTALFSKDEKVLGGIFDASALGQYLDGVDPRNSGGRETKGFINETAMHSFAGFEREVQTIADDHNSKSTFLIDAAKSRHKIINLHVHSKRLLKYRYRGYTTTPLQPISQVRDIPDWDIITSERLEALADITISDNKTFSTHKHALHDGVIDTAVINFLDFSINSNADSVYRFQHAEVIFLHTHLLEDFISHLLPLRIEPFILITHASDHSALASHQQLLEDARLIHWFAQNCEVTHPKITPIPIGLANSNWPHGDLRTFNSVRKAETMRTRTLFCAHSLSTHKERIRKTIALIENGFETYDRAFRYEEYLFHLKGSLFVASPRGNGLDCHRTWEAIYCGAVPVVDDHMMYDHFPELPILRVSDWTQVKPGTLADALSACQIDSTDKLRLTYWSHSILGKLRSIQ
jgi:hypothetical protein